MCEKSFANSMRYAEKDVRKLQSENRKLKQELMRVEDKHAEAAKKVASLQAKMKQLEKYVPKTSMKELRREGYQTTTQVRDTRSAGRAVALTSCFASRKGPVAVAAAATAALWPTRLCEWYARQIGAQSVAARSRLCRCARWLSTPMRPGTPSFGFRGAVPFM